MPFAVFDTETTGLSPAKGARILEIAVVTTDDAGRITGRYESLLNPGSGDVGLERIHRISARDVAAAPTFRDIAPKLVELFDGAALVAHNITFDWKFLVAEFGELGYSLPAAPQVCTMKASKRHRKNASSHKLEAAAADYGVGLDNAHRALADTVATAQLLEQFLTQHPDDPEWARALTAAMTTRWAALDWPAQGGYRREDIRTGGRTGWQPGGPVRSIARPTTAPVARTGGIGDWARRLAFRQLHNLDGASRA